MSLNKRCSYCGKEITFQETTIDHITPVRSGGMDRYGNIYPACKPCNTLKGHKSLIFFRRSTIGKRREFYYQTGQEIDVVRARTWMKLYYLLTRSVYVPKDGGKPVPMKTYEQPKYISNTRENLIRMGLVKPQ